MAISGSLIGGLINAPGTLQTQDAGVNVNTAKTLNFTGAGVTVSDSGSGVAGVDIPGGGGGGSITTVIKSADEYRTSNIALTADSDLVASLAAGTYNIYLNIWLEFNITPDFKWDLNFTAGVPAFTYDYSVIPLPGTAGTDITTTASNLTSPPTPAVVINYGGGAALLKIECIVVTLAAGIFQFRWAQNTSNVAPVGVRQGSSIAWFGI